MIRRAPIGPFEVESPLMESPRRAEAGVIGVPDEVRGPRWSIASVVCDAGFRGIALELLARFVYYRTASLGPLLE